MKASTLIKSEEVVLIFDGDGPEEDRTLNLTVNPGALTPAKEAAIRASDDDDSEPLATLVMELVSEWDLFDDEGALVGLDKDSLMNTPIIVLALVIDGIGREFQAKAAAEGKA